MDRLRPRERRAARLEHAGRAANDKINLLEYAAAAAAAAALQLAALDGR